MTQELVTLINDKIRKIKDDRQLETERKDAYRKAIRESWINEFRSKVLNSEDWVISEPESLKVEFQLSLAVGDNKFLITITQYAYKDQFCRYLAVDDDTQDIYEDERYLYYEALDCAPEQYNETIADVIVGLLT